MFNNILVKLAFHFSHVCRHSPAAVTDWRPGASSNTTMKSSFCAVKNGTLQNTPCFLI